MTTRFLGAKQQFPVPQGFTPFQAAAHCARLGHGADRHVRLVASDYGEHVFVCDNGRRGCNRRICTVVVTE